MTNTTQQSDPFEAFINQHLYLGDEVFIPIESPAPTDGRWHYGQYQASSTVTLYSQPNVRYSDGYALRPTNGFAHAMLRYLPDVRPGWTAIALTAGDPLLAYVRNDSANFRRSSGIYEYLLMFMISALIVMGLSVLIFLYTMPRPKTQSPQAELIKPSPFEERVEQFVARLEVALFPLE